MFSAEAVNLIAHTAKTANIEPAALLAVVEVESGGRTHANVDGRREPLIRFEGHYFDRRLSPADRQKARDEGIAAPVAGAIRNPPSQAARWRLLERAAGIDRQAAYESTSWGVGQVMGAHWSWLGYPHVEALVEEARSGLDGQLALMLRYIEKAGLLSPLHEHNWTAFARGYNGPGFARNSYHLRLSLAYRRHARSAAGAGKPRRPGQASILRRGDRGETVRELQRLLCAAGFPVAMDGAFGPQTEKTLKRFQRRHGLTADGIFGRHTRHALAKALPAGRVARAFRRAVRKLWQDHIPPWNV